ncbi:unnamed protein product [Calypogeia fissa]
MYVVGRCMFARQLALTKVALTTENARNGVTILPPIPPRSPTPAVSPILPATSSPFFPLFPQSVPISTPPVETIVLDSLPDIVPVTSCHLSPASQSPPSSALLSPNLSQHGLDSGSSSESPFTPVDSPVAADPQSTDLSCSIRNNPLLDLTWLTKDELIEMNVAIYVVDCSPILTDGTEEVITGEPYVPVLPPRHIEWECSKEDGCMWKIKNINNLAPISIAMWQPWGTVSDVEVLQCRDRALNAVTIADKPHVFVSLLPMSAFGPPKYKCQVAAGAKVKGQLDTKNSRLKDHKSKMWNWQHPFFRCSCYFKPACKGQLIWLDHAVWYMLHHLEGFFTASSIQGRFVMLIKFLSGDARRMVLDHIAFLYVREFIIEATQELIEHPEERFFAQYASSCGLRMVEAMVKPGSFSERSTFAQTGSNRKRLNLNTQPSNAPKSRGIYANPIFVPGRGRGGTSQALPGPLTRNVPGSGTSLARLCRGKNLPGMISPLLRRNIPF